MMPPITALRWSSLLALAAVVSACPPEKPPPPPPPPTRCEVDLDGLGLFSKVGTGAHAKQIESASELIGGAYAHGKVGDFLIENDRLRAVIQAPARLISPLPYGGAIIDADLKRPAGQPGRDEMGKRGIIYAFGRTPNVHTVEVLEDGANGGRAVIAATGDDAVVDYVNLSNVAEDLLPGVNLNLVVDPNKPLPLKVTTYYVLSPGESRVRILSAFCNSGAEPIVTQIGEIFEQGGVTEVFNKGGCVNGMGNVGCLVDPSTWYGSQADGVAYGFRSYEFSDRSVPAQNALIYVAGIAITLAEGENQSGVLTWVDPGATRRPGAFGILPAEPRVYLRDFFVTRDLAELSSTLLALDAQPKARLNVTAQNDDGSPAPGARVAVVEASSNVMETLIVTDDQGAGHVDLEPGNYTISTGAPGHANGLEVPVAVPSSGNVSATVKLGPSRTLTVNVKDPFDQPLPAKVTVRCTGGVCTNPITSYRRWYDMEDAPSDLQAIELVGPSGTAQIPLPPGRYEVLVTHGPEYSAWPDTFPVTGEAIDVTSADATVNATLAQVVDTTGYLSADLHVHAVGSPDSTVPNSKRVMGYAAEGVDVMVSTDHDYVTDYAPLVRDLGLTGYMTSMIGDEVTPFDFGHHNVWPITRAETPNGGAFDWAGGDGPTLRLDQMYAGLKAAYPDVVIQMNHPRSSSMGSLATLKVDTDTGASHADPVALRMEPSPSATAADTKLFSPNFDAIEVMNGTSASIAVLNDWMTFMSRGWVKVATGVSDSHYFSTVVGGYGRTWVKLGADAPGDFSTQAFAQAMKAHHAVAGSGPFIRMTAQRLDGMGNPVGTAVEPGDTLQVNVSGGETMRVTVDVQAPEWMQFTQVELYTHAPGRESFNGVANDDWPAARILDQRLLDSTMLPVEAVPGLNGFTARRVHVTETFDVSPAKDTWYVAMVRSSSAARTLVPLAWNRVSCSGGVCTASSSRAEAFTNAILVDADGSGAYDDFPLKPAQPLMSAPPPQGPGRPPTPEEAVWLLNKLMHHDHGE